MNKIKIILVIVIISTLGYLLGIKYQQSSEIQPTIVESYCAKIGEKPVSNFDLRTGKINPSIKIKDCCPGLKKIAKKQIIANKDSGICSQTQGTLDDVCSSCGDDICDPQYEDHCNCPVDCN